MRNFVKTIQVVQIGNSRYGPGKARQAACAYAVEVAIHFLKKNRGPTFRNFNDWRRVAFHRSLPYFESILGKVKNRKNPRTLIDLDLNRGTVKIIDN